MYDVCVYSICKSYIYNIYNIYIKVVIHDSQYTDCSNLTKAEHNMYGIIKIMCPTGYHHNTFVATYPSSHTTVPKCMSCHKSIVAITRRTHYFHDCIYI